MYSQRAPSHDNGATRALRSLPYRSMELDGRAACSAIIEMMSSGRLPSDALSSPPTVPEVYDASASVVTPSRAESGREQTHGARFELQVLPVQVQISRLGPRRG